MDVTQLALTWVGWQNGEKRVSNCVQIWFRPKWQQVNASAHKAWPNKLANRSNLCLLHSPLGQGLRTKMNYFLIYLRTINWILHSFYLYSGKPYGTKKVCIYECKTTTDMLVSCADGSIKSVLPSLCFDNNGEIDFRDELIFAWKSKVKADMLTVHDLYKDKIW